MKKTTTAHSFSDEFFKELHEKSQGELNMELLEKSQGGFRMMERIEYLKECNGIRELLILRGHLSIEYFLNKIIEKFLPNSNKLTSDNNLSFTKKLLLVECFNILEKDTYKFIDELNKLRNKCAHKLDYKISDKNIYELGKFLPEDISIKTYKNNELRKTYHYELLLNSITSVLVDMAYCLELTPNKK